MGSVSESLLSLPIQGPLCWDESSFPDPSVVVLKLDASDQGELRSALSKFKRIGDTDELRPDNFVLSRLGKRLEAAADEIHNGRGFAILRNAIPPSLTQDDRVLLFLGITSYLADQEGIQDAKGSVLAHITDSKKWKSVPHSQRHGIHSNRALPYHSDMGSDILCLFVREAADMGGGTFIASSLTALNDLGQNYPELAQTLFEPNWPVQTTGSDARFVLSPLMCFHDGRLLTSVDPGRLGPHPCSVEAGEKVPKLSEIQLKALEELSNAAARHEIHLPLEKNDILAFNNWALLHRRDSYEDGSETSRHLVRAWRRNSKLGWKIPESMAVPWNAAFGSLDVVKKYPTEPPSSYLQPKYTAGSAAFVLED